MGIRSKSLVRSLFNKVQWLMLYPTHLLARSYFHTKNEKNLCIESNPYIYWLSEKARTWWSKKCQQKFKFWNLKKKLNTLHTFWSWLIRCVNRSGQFCGRYRADTTTTTYKRADGWTHERTDGRTDGRTGETRIPRLNIVGGCMNNIRTKE